MEAFPTLYPEAELLQRLPQIHHELQQLRHKYQRLAKENPLLEAVVSRKTTLPKEFADLEHMVKNGLPGGDERFLHLHNLYRELQQPFYESHESFAKGIKEEKYWRDFKSYKENFIAGGISSAVGGAAVGVFGSLAMTAGVILPGGLLLAAGAGCSALTVWCFKRASTLKKEAPQRYSHLPYHTYKKQAERVQAEIEKSIIFYTQALLGRLPADVSVTPEEHLYYATLAQHATQTIQQGSSPYKSLLLHYLSQPEHFSSWYEGLKEEDKESVMHDLVQLTRNLGQIGTQLEHLDPKRLHSVQAGLLSEKATP